MASCPGRQLGLALAPLLVPRTGRLLLPGLLVLGVLLGHPGWAGAAPEGAGRDPQAARDPSLRLLSEAALVADLKTGKEIYAKGADQVRSIASISKLMAVLVVLEKGLDLEGSTVMEPGDRVVARGGAKSRIDIGTTVNNHDLLRAALMVSDNRSVPALGRAAGMDLPAFVAAMNAKAKQLGLRHTHFGDPTGLHHGNVSTARELVVVLRTALENTVISEIVRTWSTEVFTHRGKRRRRLMLVNTDKLIPGNVEVLGGKTGFNLPAGYCLAVAMRLPEKLAEATGSRDVAMIFLGTRGKHTRFAEARRVLRWLERRTPRAALPTAAVPSKRNPAPH